jgi:hypothetical protein
MRDGRNEEERHIYTVEKLKERELKLPLKLTENFSFEYFNDSKCE